MVSAEVIFDNTLNLLYMADIELKPNDKWENRILNYKVTILAVGGGFVMARRKSKKRNDHPFCEEIRVFVKKFRPETKKVSNGQA